MDAQSVKLNRLVESNNSAVITVHTSDAGNEEMESRHLVPGDLLMLSGKRFFLPCDCILLKGTCIVNEGMLTGESIPVTKIPLDQVTNCTPWKIHSGEDYKRHVLFCGTEVIQTTSSGSTPVTAVVMQTGFNTAKGDMVRSILYPKPMNFKLYQDASRFLMCLVAIAVIGFIYSVVLFVVKGYRYRIVSADTRKISDITDTDIRYQYKSMGHQVSEGPANDIAASDWSRAAHVTGTRPIRSRNVIRRSLIPRIRSFMNENDVAASDWSRAAHMGGTRPIRSCDVIRRS
ncbi:unnamed protein product [Ranitomeya imitator]|uniref:P-type ATPase A domain-containing protein n=1 Tax=Ranitomeya imitator TaxID=111125 RepID=A0ABN9KYH7_9NEOB|nr:unnamed protein product [Ranitomeya imitator]